MQDDLQRLRNRITQIERTSAQRSTTAVEIVRERQGALAQVTDQLTVSVQVLGNRLTDAIDIQEKFTITATDMLTTLMTEREGRLQQDAK